MDKEKSKKKKEPVWLIILQEMLLTGLFLCVFAMFHHVLPRMSYAQQEPEESMASEIVPPVESEKPAADPYGWRAKFAEHFTEETVITDNSYTSPNISVTISTKTLKNENYKTVYYLADIYLADLDSFRAFAMNEDFERYDSAPAEELAAMSKAVISINGDYCNTGIKGLFFARNGVVYQGRMPDCDICVLYGDGVMETYAPEEYTVDELRERSLYQVWRFGPRLLDSEGEPLETFNTSAAIAWGNPRSAVGYYEPGHYCFLVADGRQDGWSKGLTIAELAQVFSELGCKAAYNLDGGASATMTFNGALYSRQSSPRELGDVLIIREPDTGGEGQK